PLLPPPHPLKPRNPTVESASRATTSDLLDTAIVGSFASESVRPASTRSIWPGLMCNARAVARRRVLPSIGAEVYGQVRQKRAFLLTLVPRSCEVEPRREAASRAGSNGAIAPSRPSRML